MTSRGQSIQKETWNTKYRLSPSSLLQAGKREIRVYNQRLHNIQYDVIQLRSCFNKADQVKCLTQTERHPSVDDCRGSSHHTGKTSRRENGMMMMRQWWWEDGNRPCVGLGGVSSCASILAPRRSVSSQLRRTEQRRPTMTRGADDGLRKHPLKGVCVPCVSTLPAE